MRQYEAVIDIMEQNGGFATLGYLYQKVLKIPGVEWKTKTPFASIRRIVQDERFFFKIRPGLWALKNWKNKLPEELRLDKVVSEKTKEEFNHSYYQGLLVEIGNLKGYKTFIPNQDKNKSFLDKKLGDIISMKDFYQFTYEYLMRKAQTIDVSWFNRRKMPDSFFEVEYSTDIQRSLLKFVELQDFNVKFFIIADKIRQKEFESKVLLDAFDLVKKRVKFLDYERLSEWHTRICELASLENNLVF